jgi:hypothetical protein
VPVSCSVADHVVDLDGELQGWHRVSEEFGEGVAERFELEADEGVPVA